MELLLNINFFNSPCSTISPTKTFAIPAMAITTFCDTVEPQIDCINCNHENRKISWKVNYIYLIYKYDLDEVVVLLTTNRFLVRGRGPETPGPRR